MRILLLVGAVVILAACNDTKPLTPTSLLTAATTPVTVYTGTIVDAVEGTGSIDVLLSPSAESSPGGTWDESFPGQKTTTRFISGTLNGTSYSATVSDCPPGSSQPCTSTCRLTFIGTLTSGTLSGSYAEAAGDSCATVRHGTVNAATR